MGRTADSRCRCCRTRVRGPRPPCPRRCSRVRSTFWGRTDAANRCPLGVAPARSRSPCPPLTRCPLARPPPSRLLAAAACRWLKSFCLKKKQNKFMTVVYENPYRLQTKPVLSIVKLTFTSVFCVRSAMNCKTRQLMKSGR
jgi:hypothetical protein